MTKNAPRMPEEEGKAGASDNEAPGLSADNSSNGSPVMDQAMLPPQNPVSPHDHSQHSHSPACSKTHDHSHNHGPSPTTQDCSGMQSSATMIISPEITPGSTQVHTTPTSGYSDFMQAGRDGCDPAVSPSFNLDWSQMQMPFGNFEMHRPDMMMSPNFPFSPSGFMDGQMMEPMNFMSMANQGMPMGGMQIAMPTPDMDAAYPCTAPASLDHSHSYFPATRQSSISASDVDSNTASQDAWSAFRCTPCVPSSACPKTAKHNLERLEQSLKSHDSWSSWRPTWDEADFALGDKLAVMPLQEMPRDKLLAITQSFLHKALDIHKDEHSAPSSANVYNSNFVILPPARVLEFFLQSYVNGFERYYPLTAKGTLNANELLQGYSDKASSLLLLLMIAQGAMITPSVDARWLTAGLTEACRISLFDLIEKNIMLSGDQTVLQSALLFTVQAAWSGDKWQMDIAMGQRGMYLSMLRHSGLLTPRAPVRAMNQRLNVDSLWNEWVQQESRSRSVQCVVDLT